MSYQVKIEQLTGDNYDTWKVLMKSLLIKNDFWEYVCGEKLKPKEKDEEWKKADQKAKADIILSVSPPLLKDIKDCESSHEVWTKLKETYDSKIPTRKAALLKKLILTKASNNDDLEKHVSNFFDTVNKIKSIDIIIDDDLLSILLLYSLPEQFESFRIAIESRDELPKPSTLKIKIIEEYHSRCAQSSQTQSSDVLTVDHHKSAKQYNNRNKSSNTAGKNKNNRHKIMCYRCKKYGHKSAECRTNLNYKEKTSFIEESFLAVNTSNTGISKWILDSGATSHIVNDSYEFISMENLTNGELKLANQEKAEIKGKGTVRVDLENGNKIKLLNTLYVPEVRTNLLSVGKITDNNYIIIFYKNKAIIKNKNNKIILEAEKINGLYQIKTKKMKNEVNYVSQENKFIMWHQRFGHVNFGSLKQAIKRQQINGVSVSCTSLKRTPMCEICIQSKQTRKPFDKTIRERFKEPLQLIHSDVCGPFKIKSAGGSRYLLTFIDDYTRWCEVYFLKSKNETLKCFKEFKAKVENCKNNRIKILRTDNGKEYVNKDFADFLKISGIQHQLTAEYTPQQNGVAERKNRTLIEMARCMLLGSKLPTYLWAEAISTANYLRNRLPSNSLNGEIPYMLWKGRRPNVKHLKTFGTHAYVLQKQQGRNKFAPKSIPYYLVGYSNGAYRLWHKETGKLIKSRDVKFIEEKVDTTKNEDYNILTYVNVAPHEEEKEGIKQEQEKEHEDENEGKQDTEKEAEEIKPILKLEKTESESKTIKKGKGRPRIIRTGRKGRPRKLFCNVEDNVIHNQNDDSEGEMDKIECRDKNEIQKSDDHDDEIESNVDLYDKDETETSDDDYLDVDNYFAAENIEDPDKWQEAIIEELKAHEKNKTWDIVDKPKNAKIIGCRWVLTKKINENGDLVKRKARLVAKGCSQRYGIDFQDTYSPVAKQKSIRILITIAVKYKMHLHQFDITTAYLNGELDTTLYMKLPEHFDKFSKQSTENKVCRLKKAIYGLKQSGRIWYKKLDDYLIQIGCERMQAEPCLYRRKQNDKLMIICIYVDDILIAANSIREIEWFKKQMNKMFELKDLGKLRHFLGIDVQYYEDGSILLTQEKFVEKILRKFSMENCNPTNLPMDPNTKLTKVMCPKSDNERRELERIPYQNVVGSLLYLSNTTRPDIAYAVNVLSQFNNNFGKAHWLAAKRVLRYLKGTINNGIIFRGTSDDLSGYVDADWGSSPDDRRSYSGYIFKWGNCLISWEVKKQKTVALSSAEAEFIALTESTKEALHLRNLLQEMGFRSAAPIKIFNDNNSAQLIATNPEISGRCKHIDLRYHFIREAVNEGKISLHYMNTNSMPADIFTKALTTGKFKSHLKDLCIRSKN